MSREGCFFGLSLLMILREILRLLRPADALKNLLVFAPLVFAGGAGELSAWPPLLILFAAFCACASAVYIFNDLLDRGQDRRHPIKARRPLAAGTISPRTAVLLSLLLLAVGMLLAGLTDPVIMLILGIYVFQNIFYSLILKKILLIDLIIIALGYLLRVYAGGYTAEVPVSNWILMMTALLSFIISIGKRRDDLALIGTDHEQHKRPDYSLRFLKILMFICIPLTALLYLVYTLDPAVSVSHHREYYFLSALPVWTALAAYAKSFLKSHGLGSPVRLLARNLWIGIPLLLWIALQWWFHTGEGW